MRYVTTTTLNAHLESSSNVIIYIPAGELIETTPEQAGISVRFRWRGQQLNVETQQLQTTVVPAEPATAAGR